MPHIWVSTVYTRGPSPIWKWTQEIPKWRYPPWHSHLRHVMKDFGNSSGGTLGIHGSAGLLSVSCVNLGFLPRVCCAGFLFLHIVSDVFFLLCFLILLHDNTINYLLFPYCHNGPIFLWGGICTCPSFAIFPSAIPGQAPVISHLE